MPRKRTHDEANILAVPINLIGGVIHGSIAAAEFAQWGAGGSRSSQQTVLERT